LLHAIDGAALGTIRDIILDRPDTIRNGAAGEPIYITTAKK